ncbi:hypothetical protein EGW08_009370, partial [Elysia chlorotica]
SLSSAGTPNTLSAHSSAQYRGEYVFSLENDVHDQLLRQVEMLKAEIHKLRSEKHDLLRQHAAQEKDSKALREQILALTHDLKVAQESAQTVSERQLLHNSTNDSGGSTA